MRMEKWIFPLSCTISIYMPVKRGGVGISLEFLARGRPPKERVFSLPSFLFSWFFGEKQRVNLIPLFCVGFFCAVSSKSLREGERERERVLSRFFHDLTGVRGELRIPFCLVLYAICPLFWFGETVHPR